MIEGKICLVTGGTAGVGLATARGLARLGATVVIVGRDRQRAEAAAREIRKENGSAAIELFIADLSIQRSIRDLAARFKDRHGRLDVLANCAGALFYNRRETEDGIEATWAVDYLSHFLLTHLLLDVLRIGAPSRVITVAGGPGMLRRAGIDFDDIQMTKSYSGIRGALQAGLARLVFSREMARRLDAKVVAANAFHPGLVRSDLTRDLPAVMRLLAAAGRPFMSRECAAAVHLASSPEVEGISGGYFVKKKIRDPGPVHADETTAERLWRISEEMTGCESS